MLNDSGNRVTVEISAVKVRIGEERAAVMFVDNRTRTIFGQKYIDAKKNALEDIVSRYAEDVLANLKVCYQREATLAERKGTLVPSRGCHPSKDPGNHYVDDRRRLIAGAGRFLPAEGLEELPTGRFADDTVPIRRGECVVYRPVRFFRDHLDVPHDSIVTVEFLPGLPRETVRVEPHDPDPERPRTGWNDAVRIV